MSAKEQAHRILSIDPSTCGFGFVVLETPNHLIDCGVKQARGAGKNAICLRKVRSLLTLYIPDLVILEQRQVGRSQRSQRVLQLQRDIEKLAASCQIYCRRVSLNNLRRTFTIPDLKNKHTLALAVAKLLPELVARVEVPPVRQVWMSENPLTRIYMAAARALVSARAPLAHSL